MTPHKLINLRLRRRMQILKLMHRLELDHIQPIREHPIRFPLQQMLTLIRRNMRHRCEHIRTMRGGPFNAVSMIDTTFASFVIDVEILQIVVEVDATGTKVPTEKGGVGCEDGGDVDVTFSEEGDGEACLPFVEVRYYGGVELTGDVLDVKKPRSTHGIQE